MEAYVAILSMSAKKKKIVLDRVRSHSMQIACHLFLVVAFPGAQEQNHWRKEIRNFFTEVNRWRKRSSVLIPDSVILQILYEEPLGTKDDKAATLEEAIDNMKDFSSNPIPDRSALESTDFLDLIRKLLDNPRYLQDHWL
jgi:hypothetical protein